MAGNDDGQHVRAVCAADGAAGVRNAEALRHPGIGAGLGSRNRSEQLPGAKLEVRTDRPAEFEFGSSPENNARAVPESRLGPMRAGHDIRFQSLTRMASSVSNRDGRQIRATAIPCIRTAAAPSGVRYVPQPASAGLRAVGRIAEFGEASRNNPPQSKPLPFPPGPRVRRGELRSNAIPPAAHVGLAGIPNDA